MAADGSVDISKHDPNMELNLVFLQGASPEDVANPGFIAMMRGITGDGKITSADVTSVTGVSEHGLASSVRVAVQGEMSPTLQQKLRSAFGGNVRVQRSASDPSDLPSYDAVIA